MKAISQFVREYLLAVQFFTRIPITGKLAEWVGFSPEMFRASAAHFPGVGVLIGAMAALVYALLQACLPNTLYTPLAIAVLTTALTVLLTGGFHEDGLTDVADGLGGSSDRERALDIMKDSRIGAFGTLALVLALMAKVALLAILGSVEGAPTDWEEAPFDAWFVCCGLWAGHVVSRGLPLMLIYLLPHVGDTARSKSKPLAEQISSGSLLLAFGWCFVTLAAVSSMLGVTTVLVACSFAVVAMLWMGRLFKRRLQGFTGDCLGATQQICEIAFYFGLGICL